MKILLFSMRGLYNKRSESSLPGEQTCQIDQVQGAPTIVPGNNRETANNGLCLLRRAVPPPLQHKTFSEKKWQFVTPPSQKRRKNSVFVNKLQICKHILIEGQNPYPVHLNIINWSYLTTSPFLFVINISARIMFASGRWSCGLRQRT